MNGHFWLDLILAIAAAIFWFGAFGWFWWNDLKRIWSERGRRGF